MNARAKFCLGLLVVTGGLLLSSCSLVPQAQPDPTRFFVLSAMMSAPPQAPAGKAPVVHLRPVELAS